MFIKQLSFTILVLLGLQSLGNGTSSASISIDNLYGGANCNQRDAGDGTDCNEGSPSCIFCSSGGVNTKCVTYKNSYNCLACTGPTTKDCGGSAYDGDPDPNRGPGHCINGQLIGQCSRTYNEATSGGCSGGQSACP
jgi:hypothetical protein